MKTFFTFKKIRFIYSLITLFLLFSTFLLSNLVYATAGVPMLINFQGRLMDNTGELLGSPSGTDYCYKFSIWNDDTGGSKIWPAGSPSTDTITTRSGVFDATIGEADALTLTFTDDQAFVEVEVATMVGPDCTATGGAESFETLTPRPQIVSSGFAINSSTVGGFTPSQTATINQIPVVDSLGKIVLSHATTAGIASSGANPFTIDAGTSGILNLNNTSTGDILLGGGSGSTGCTLTNSSGAFACTGNITGPTTGTIGYWARSGTTLSQATANDVLSLSGNTGDILTIASSATGSANKALNISQTGATSGTDYAGYFSNTGAATTNVGLYATASGATNNYAAIFEAGNVGIGTTTPGALLSVGTGSVSNFKVNADGDITSSFTALNGSTTANGADTNSTTLILTSATNFDIGNYVKVDPTGANICSGAVTVCYAKITAIATNTLTITPALTWDTGASVASILIFGILRRTGNERFIFPFSESKAVFLMGGGVRRRSTRESTNPRMISILRLSCLFFSSKV